MSFLHAPQHHENKSKGGCVSASHSHRLQPLHTAVRSSDSFNVQLVSVFVCTHRCMCSFLMFNFDVNKEAHAWHHCKALFHQLSLARPAWCWFSHIAPLAWIHSYRQPAGLVCQVRHGSSVWLGTCSLIQIYSVKANQIWPNVKWSLMRFTIWCLRKEISAPFFI